MRNGFRAAAAGLVLAFVLASSVRVAAEDADENAALSEKYGTGEIVVSPEERAQDQQYGGFPNNAQFNNNTKCRKVVAMFDKPGMGPRNPEMVAFLSYSRVKLMESDIAVHVFQKTKLVVDIIGKEKWKLLPALYPVYCRTHMRDTMEEATLSIILAARLSPLLDSK